MKIRVVDEHKELLREPYVVRLGGWTLERYLEEAPEHLFWEFVWRSSGVFTSDSGAAVTDQVSAVSRVPRRHRMGRGAQEKGDGSVWPKALEAMTR
jgi:hypothetical protein